MWYIHDQSSKGWTDEASKLHEIFLVNRNLVSARCVLDVTFDYTSGTNGSIFCLEGKMARYVTIYWVMGWIFRHPVIAQWTHGYDGSEVYALAQQHRLPPTKHGLATANADCPICQQQRPILSPQYGTAIQDDHSLTLVAGWVDCTVSIIERIVLFPYWQRQLFWIWICLPCI